MSPSPFSIFSMFAKPSIVLVPGAWLGLPFYQPAITALQIAGYSASIASYPSLAPANPFKADCQADSNVVREYVRKLVEDRGKDVVLLMHSYAGMPGSAAAKGLSKTQRAREGKKGGVLGLAVVGGFLVPEGVSCAGLQGGALPPWILLDNPGPGLNVADDPVDNFAADVRRPLTSLLTNQLNPHSTLAFTSPQPPPAWADDDYKGKLAAIVTTQDRAVPEAAQRGMISATGKTWIVKTMNASHCAPFMDKLPEFVRQVDAIVDQFRKSC